MQTTEGVIVIEQLKTIREDAEWINTRNTGGMLQGRARNILAALAQLEAMVGEQEPVAWAVYWGLPPTRQNSVHFDKESAQAVANQIKSATEVRPLYAAPVAQQPQAEAVPPDVVRDAERYRWLRNESWAGYNTGKGTPSVYTVDGAGNRRMMLAEEAMDDAIDAAIAQQKGN